MEYITTFFSGAAGAALVAGIFSLIQRHQDKKSALVAGMRYMLLYIIQERAMAAIKAKEITLADRRLLHKWHDCYHDGLGGNGDAKELMEDVDALPLKQ